MENQIETKAELMGFLDKLESTIKGDWKIECTQEQKRHLEHMVLAYMTLATQKSDGDVTDEIFGGLLKNLDDIWDKKFKLIE